MGKVARMLHGCAWSWDKVGVEKCSRLVQADWGFVDQLPHGVGSFAAHLPTKRHKHIGSGDSLEGVEEACELGSERCTHARRRIGSAQRERRS